MYRSPGGLADAPQIASLARQHEPGRHVVDVQGESFLTTYLTLTALEGESIEQLAERLGEIIRERSAEVLWVDVFGPGELFPSGQTAIARQAAPAIWPLMWLDSDRKDVPTPLCLQAVAVSGVEVEDVVLEGRVVGKRFEDQFAHYCYLSDLRSPDPGVLRMAQAQKVYTDMRAALAQLGMEFADVVRTWLYMERILEWYDDFNVVRTSFYRSTGVLGHTLPASTGIGASIPAGGAIVAKALALRPKGDTVRAFAAPSPLQCPAFDYASAFSRAMEVDHGNERTLYVSGTASIEPGGRTMHLDDMTRQVDLTMGVLNQLLKSRGMQWSDVTRAVAYFKDLKQVSVFKHYLEAHELPRLPLVCLQSEVCREELLFEIELDASVSH